MYNSSWNQIKNLFKISGSWFMWLAPFSLLLLSLTLPTYLFKLDFLRFIDIIVWPFATLTALFFFKKVFTYLFFSMEEFNFFGLKGNLKHIDEVILEEVNNRLLDKANEEKRKAETDKLNLEITNKGTEIEKAKGSEKEYKKLAFETLNDWRRSTEQSQKLINILNTENKRLRDIISSFPSNMASVSSSIVTDYGKTSDPVLEESNINKK
ncbi:MAG: hypothetical protein WCT36_05725 [Candidatus Gracilibacteria bacterium]